MLRGGAAVAAITAGAVVGPVGAIFATVDSCQSNPFVAVGLAAAALYALIIAGLAAFVGDRIGGSPWFERNRRRGTRFLVAVGLIGVLGWIAALATLGGCP